MVGEMFEEVLGFIKIKIVKNKVEKGIEINIMGVGV